MGRDDDTLDAVPHRTPRLLGVEYAFQNYRQPGQRPEPRHVLPCERGGLTCLFAELPLDARGPAAGRQLVFDTKETLFPAPARGVDSQDDGPIPRALRPSHEPLRERTGALVDVELEPEWTRGSRRDVFEGARGDRADRHERPGFSRRPGSLALPLGVGQTLHARRGHHDRRPYGGVEYGGYGSRVVHAAQHARNEAEPFEGIALRPQGDLVVRPAG